MIRIAHVVNQVSVTTGAVTRVNKHNRGVIQPYLISFYDTGIDREGFALRKDVGVLALGGLSLPRKLRWLKDYVVSERIQVLHTYHGRSSFWTRWVACALRVPNVFEDAATHWSHGTPSRVALMANAFLCDLILCPSHAVLDSYSWIERSIFARGPVRIIPYGISLPEMSRTRADRAEELSRYGVDPRCFVFIHTGRMVPIKDQDFLIRLFSEVARLSPRAHLLLVGDGPSRAGLERLVQSAGLGQRITFTGMVLREGVYRLLKTSDAFIMTSRSEGLSVSLIEALACGLPAVLTDIPSFRETMKEGKAAIFLHREDSLSLSALQIVRQLIEDPTAYERRRLEAIRLARTIYDGRVWMKALEDLYRELVSRRQASAILTSH